MEQLFEQNIGSSGPLVAVKEHGAPSQLLSVGSLLAKTVTVMGQAAQGGQPEVTSGSMAASVAAVPMVQVHMEPTKPVVVIVANGDKSAVNTEVAAKGGVTVAIKGDATDSGVSSEETEEYEPEVGVVLTPRTGYVLRDRNRPSKGPWWEVKPAK